MLKSVDPFLSNNFNKIQCGISNNVESLFSPKWYKIGPFSMHWEKQCTKSRNDLTHGD